MRLEDLGNLGEFIGALAVVATLIYLAVQIRQNTRSVRAASSWAFISLINEMANVALANPRIAEAIRAGISDPEGLDPEAAAAFDAFARRYFRFYENLHHQSTQSLVDPVMFRSWGTEFQSNVRARGLSSWWSSHRGDFTPKFREFVDSIMDRYSKP